MIGLTIEKLSNMSRQDADALRAIAECYHPLKRNENMDVSTLKVSVQRGMPGALETLAELNDANRVGQQMAELKAMITPATIVINDTPAQVASLGEQFLASVQDTTARVGATAKLHPDDNPAAGAPDQHALADQVFSGGVIPTSENAEVDPVAVFSGGVASLIADLNAMPDNPDSMALILPNVHAAIPTPPPLPLVTSQTLPLQSGAATTVSLPPPPPPAPGPASASADVATTSPAQVELDKAGLPWDGRIHASTKTKTAKDVWTRRRGVDDTLVAEVEAQLRAAMAVPVPPAPPVLDFAALNTGAATPAPTFPTLMSFITERIGAGRLNQAQVTAAVQAVGLESLNLVMARVDLVPAIMDELRKVAP